MRDITESVRVSEGGRIVVPAAIRHALNIEVGDQVTISLVDDEIRVLTKMQGIGQARALAARFLRDRPSMVDELIAERRSESARE